MKRLVLSITFWVCLVAIATAVNIYAQSRLNAPAQNEPGKPTEARFFILNQGKAEAVPVTLEGALVPVDVRMTGTPSVLVSGTPTVLIGGNPLVQTRETRQLWEYRLLTVTSAGTDPAALNTAGLDGWEAAGVIPQGPGSSMIILKRPK